MIMRMVVPVVRMSSMRRKGGLGERPLEGAVELRGGSSVRGLEADETVGGAAAGCGAVII